MACMCNRTTTKKYARHMNSEKQWQHAPGLHRSNPDGSQHWMGEGDLNPDQKAISNWQLLTKEKLVSPRESHWVYEPHLRTGPKPSNRRTTFFSIWGFVFVSLCLVWALFYFPGLFVYVLWFPILCFYGFSAFSECVCASCAFSLFLLFVFSLCVFCSILACLLFHLPVF